MRLLTRRPYLYLWAGACALIAEVALFRFLTRLQFGRNNWVIGVYGDDVWLPVIAGAFLLLKAVERKKIHIPGNRQGLILHLGLLVAAVAWWCTAPLWGIGFVPCGVLVGLLGTFASILTIPLCLYPIPAIRAWIGQNTRLAATAIGSLLLIVYYPKALEKTWHWLSYSVAWLSQKLIVLMGYDATMSLTWTPVMGKNVPHVVISHPLYTARIARPCSGQEGIFFFLFLFSLLVAFFDVRMSRLRLLGTYVAGVAWMYVLNIVRVTLLMLFAYYLSARYGAAQGAQYSLLLFHSNIGWILYGIGIITFFRAVLKDSAS